MKRQHIGSNFDDFLKQEGLLPECEAGALKRVVAWQLQRGMPRGRTSRAKLASRMKMGIHAAHKLPGEGTVGTVNERKS